MSRKLPAHSRRATSIVGHRHGFTLVELLTVIAIISILMAIIIPTVGTVQLAARKAKSTSNLSNIGKGFSLYANDNHGLLPAPKYGVNPGTASNAAGSSNPTEGTWLEELVPFLEGQLQNVPGSTAATVVKWPDVLTDPQFLAVNSVVTDPHVRGYGMMVFPFRADPKSPNANTPYFTQRQSLQFLPNQSNNILVGTSNALTLEPSDDGTFPMSGTQYTNGDPRRFRSYGLYLFVDNHVDVLDPGQAAKVLAPPSSD